MATATAARRRAQAKTEYNAFLQVCPSRQVLARLSDKWVTLVLCAVAERPMRYGEITRAVAGVSQKMLTQTLRGLERDGLLSREVTPTVPVTVTYSMTPLGESLHTVVEGIKDWAETHMDQINDAREAYDSRVGTE
ncbi:winged helix-turn-helix transcriptional regulator [Flexivirga meconopsidis]|uniref:winged helix-turn-helix transcriptional regulator n=1 Tax=Flexivirga meconopsidis TaxID=2977121 RepID=UPI002240B824